ncbi:MAG TPA: CoA pyrophosphatase, partial [Accumulibacter sp.]|nr:CoA pyrophosphatase [Accumulibacter sp.]
MPAPALHAHVLEDGVGDEPLTEAAVLFPIVDRQPEPTVLLTQRTAHLKDHPGQISFPGGRCEEEDASPSATALREAGQAFGLAARHSKLIGYLPESSHGTGSRMPPH